MIHNSRTFLLASAGDQGTGVLGRALCSVLLWPSGENVVVDPHRYCREALERVRRDTPPSVICLGEHQKVANLRFVAQQDLSARDFERQLKLLIGVAERSGRQLLAEATREILLDWQCQTAENREAST